MGPVVNYKDSSCVVKMVTLTLQLLDLTKQGVSGHVSEPQYPAGHRLSVGLSA